MTEVGGEPLPGRGADPESEEVLRAKYLDYCSAQVADVFLRLSPDDIYVLAQDAARERGDAESLSFDGIVKALTDSIGRRMVLPPFDVWAEDYRKHPKRYEGYLLGLWENETGPS